MTEGRGKDIRRKRHIPGLPDGWNIGRVLMMRAEKKIL